jgi:hypothetical protein
VNVAVVVVVVVVVAVSAAVVAAVVVVVVAGPCQLHTILSVAPQCCYGELISPAI